MEAWLSLPSCVRKDPSRMTPRHCCRARRLRGCRSRASAGAPGQAARAPLAGTLAPPLASRAKRPNLRGVVARQVVSGRCHSHDGGISSMPGAGAAPGSNRGRRRGGLPWLLAPWRRGLPGRIASLMTGEHGRHPWEPRQWSGFRISREELEATWPRNVCAYI